MTLAPIPGDRSNDHTTRGLSGDDSGRAQAPWRWSERKGDDGTRERGRGRGQIARVGRERLHRQNGNEADQQDRHDSIMTISAGQDADCLRARVVGFSRRRLMRAGVGRCRAAAAGVGRRTRDRRRRGQCGQFAKRRAHKDDGQADHPQPGRLHDGSRPHHL